MPSQTSLANPAGTITFGAVETQFNASPIFSDGAANTMLTTGITSGQL